MTPKTTKIHRRSFRPALLALAVTLAATVAGCAASGSGTPSATSGTRSAAVVEDTVVTGRVRSALVDDPLTQAHQIDVETYRGVVQLSGFVDTAEQRERATAIARGVAGVRDVNNELELRTR